MRHKFWWSIIIGVATILGTVGLVRFYSQIAIATSKNCTGNPSVTSFPNIKAQARAITVKVIAGNSRGSGTILKRQKNIYWIVTNAHVVRSSDNIRVESNEGWVYPARLISSGDDSSDLAILEFRSLTHHKVAKLGTPRPDQKVISAGFPSEGGGMNLIEGQISQILSKSLVGGYSLGYTSLIQKGMSGGPVLNELGEVVGINGILAEPLWGDPHIFSDGTRPNSEQKHIMQQLSWGIGMDKVIRLNPSVFAASLIESVEQEAQDVTVLIRGGDDHGSGVLIAHNQGNYYVLTAGHVIKNQTSYNVITKNGSCHEIGSIHRLEGIDLAVIEFKSNQTLKIATLADYRRDSGFIPGLVAGWRSSDGWYFSLGRVFDPELGVLGVFNSESLLNGYDLVYSNVTGAGMSGGPVFDLGGRVIGIHGRSEGEVMIDGSGEVRRVQLGYSLGVPITTFIRVSPNLSIKPDWLKLTQNKPPALSANEQELLRHEMRTQVVIPSGNDAIALINYGHQLWRLNRFDESLKAFDQAIALDDQFYQAWYGKGLTLRLMRQFDQAVQAFDKSIQLSSGKFIPALRAKAETLGLMGNHEEALATIDQALITIPDDLTLHGLRGYALQQLKRYREAIASYNISLQMRPHAWGYNYRGESRLALGEPQAAIADFNQAINLKPDYIRAYINRGNTRLSLGDQIKGKADLKTAEGFY